MQSFDIIGASINVYPVPDVGAIRSNELLFGERVSIVDSCERNGNKYFEIHSLHDHYQGFVEQEGLQPSPDPDKQFAWRINVQRSPVFLKADIKSQVVGALGFGACLYDGVIENDMMHCLLGWVPVCHLRSCKQFYNSLGEAALNMLHSPYLWGGRSHHGLDCSGLVQHAMAACGMAASRDSTMQQEEIGDEVLFSHVVDLCDDDLLFWPGHVGLVCNQQLLHANAYSMKTSFETLDKSIERIGKTCNSLVPRIRRIKWSNINQQ